MKTLILTFGVVLSVVTPSCLGDEYKRALTRSYTLDGYESDEIQEELRAAAETVEGDRRLHLQLRLAELSGSQEDYARAFLFDTNSVEALCGLVATSSWREDIHPWVERWIRLDPANALPHYFAAWHWIARSSYPEGFRSLLEGSEKGAAYYRPLHQRLLNEETLEFSEVMRLFADRFADQARRGTGTKMIVLWQGLYENVAEVNRDDPVAILEELRKASDILACMEPLLGTSMLVNVRASKYCLQRIVELDAPKGTAMQQSNHFRIAVREWMLTLLVDRIRQAADALERREVMTFLEPEEAERLCTDLRR